MPLKFEWDAKKSRSNRVKHGIDFEEAKTVFNDPYAITIADPEHSVSEDRYIDLGFSSRGRLLVVFYTERGLNIRIISSRKPTAEERKSYEKREI